MKKTLFHHLVLALFLSIVGITTDANAQVRYLVVQQIDNTETAFALEEQPIITCKDNIFHVVTESRSIDIPLENLLNYHFTESYSAINETYEPKELIVSTRNNISIRGMKPNATIKIFSTDGKLCFSGSSNYNGETEVSMSELGKGIFILKTDTSTIKIINY